SECVRSDVFDHACHTSRCATEAVKAAAPRSTPARIGSVAACGQKCERHGQQKPPTSSCFGAERGQGGEREKSSIRWVSALEDDDKVLVGRRAGAGRTSGKRRSPNEFSRKVGQGSAHTCVRCDRRRARCTDYERRCSTSFHMHVFDRVELQ